MFCVIFKAFSPVGDSDISSMQESYVGLMLVINLVSRILSQNVPLVC